MTRIRLRLVLANICNNPEMPQGFVESDLQAIAELEPDVVVATEIGPRRYKQALQRIFGAVGLTVCALARETPIAVRSTIPVARSWWQRLHDGLAKVTPARFNTYVHLDLVPGLPIVVIGKHTVSGAFRKGANAARTTDVPARRRFWWIDYRLTRRRVAHLVRRGAIVFILGDLNDLHPKAYHPAQRELAGHGLMHVLVIAPAGIPVDVLERLYIPEHQLHTDHPVDGVEVSIAVPNNLKENR